jgi:glycosyltransferase involved in cell wall biosynthesis
LIHTEHGRVFPDKLRYMAAEHLLSHVAYKVVGVSDRTLKDLHRYERIAPAKLVRIANGIELGAFDRSIDRSAKREALGLPATGPLIGVVARLDEAKGLSYLLQALPRLVSRFANLRVVVAGTGALLDTLRAEAAALGVAGRVSFLGLRLDVPELLHLFDVYVLPSVREGLPMGLIEAMAARRAIVATDVGGVGTLIQSNVTGLLTPARDPDALAEAIATLLLDDALRQRLSAAAQRVAHEQYSAAAMTRAYERLYSRSID